MANDTVAVLATVELVLGSFAIACLAGLALGAIAARARGLALIVESATFLLACVPFFVLPLIVDFAFVVHNVDPTADRIRFLAPACTLALLQIPFTTTFFHWLLDSGNASAGRVSGDILALLARYLPLIIAGDVVVEILFAWPGAARHLFGDFVDLVPLLRFLLASAAVTVALRVFSRSNPPASTSDAGERSASRVTTIAVIAVLACVGFYAGAAALQSKAFAIDEAHWMGRPLPPCFVDRATCGGHVLGTDEIGRDLAARLIVGGRTTFDFAGFAVLVELVIAAALVALARLGTPLRAGVRYLAGAFSALPLWPALVGLFIFFTEVRSERAPGPALMSVALACLIAPPLALRAIDSPRRTLLGRIFSDWAAAVLVLSTVDFFGYGTQPPTPSWGNMLANAQQSLELAWWNAYLPAACIFVCVLALRVASRYAAPSTSALTRLRSG